MSATVPRSPRKQSAYREIAEGIRRQILEGRFAPKTRLPTTRELAARLNSSNCTVHHALTLLVREGWLERLAGDGTYLAEGRNPFVCAGIYQYADLLSNEGNSFQRSLNASLLRQLEAMGKESLIFVDPRPLELQKTVLPELQEAVMNRRIQGLIAPTVNHASSQAVLRLPIPVAYTADSSTRKQVGFDTRQFLRDSVARLAEQGCRSIGFLTSSRLNAESTSDLERAAGLLAQVCRELGVEIRDEWIAASERNIERQPSYGYRTFLGLWQRPDKPEGLIVYPDGCAVGVINAVLESGMGAVTSRMKFVFHRNAHLDLLCPFPVTWAISDEDKMAAGLIEMLERQFTGREPEPIRIPFQFVRADSATIPGE